MKSKNEIGVFRPKDEWEFDHICNRSHCFGKIKPSGLCGKHERRWLARRRFFAWVKSLFFTKRDKYSEPEIEIESLRSPTELGLYEESKTHKI